MPTLVIHAPKYQVQQNGKKSFNATLVDGRAEGYAINRRIFAIINNNRNICKVVLLSNDEQLRAKGTLIRLQETEMTGNHIQRYNIYIKGLRIVPYRPERLNRNGVNIIR